MSIELRTGRGGKLRSTWYGRYEVNGKRYTINLGVKVSGTPPKSLSLRDEGDKSFERSRAQANERLNQIIEEARRKHDSAHLVERIYEIKTGEEIKSVTLDDLPEEWQKIPRRRKPNERYAAQCRSTLTRFAEFVRSQNPKADEISHVTRDMARAFMSAEESRGVTAKTWNDTLKLLRASYKYLLPAGSINPFSSIPTRETETIFRKPFTPEELKAIVDAARDDDFIRPILITGMCTAMRRGDCCLLKWKDVDLPRRFITVKTNKTGVTVSIPIFPMLYDELALRQPSEAYVFPEQAKMYVENSDGITWRVRKILAAAGFKDADENGETVQTDDAEIVRGEIHAKREGGLRRASIRDFHSFRVTWVTLALTAGVPLELVQKVTGHRTTDIVLKHYFQPGREEFRRALQSAMPKLLTNGHKTPKEEILAILDRTTAKSWQKDAKRLRELVASI
ncbi:MAG TPA: tyrosine-type recombinase/integrase [Verrucomicrobiae bacterium]|nr:tyrosine-type recombinase/integrase [Verrucomicrobiae bacterium]